MTGGGVWDDMPMSQWPANGELPPPGDAAFDALLDRAPLPGDSASRLYQLAGVFGELYAAPVASEPAAERHALAAFRAALGQPAAGTAPAGPAPARTAPARTAPAGAGPAGPTRSRPDRSGPGQTAPGQTAPGQTGAGPGGHGSAPGSPRSAPPWWSRWAAQPRRPRTPGPCRACSTGSPRTTRPLQPARRTSPRASRPPRAPRRLPAPGLACVPRTSTPSLLAVPVSSGRRSKNWSLPRAGRAT